MDWEINGKNETVELLDKSEAEKVLSNIGVNKIEMREETPSGEELYLEKLKEALDHLLVKKEISEEQRNRYYERLEPYNHIFRDETGCCNKYTVKLQLKNVHKEE